MCLVCDKSMHKYIVRACDKCLSICVKDCLTFKSASNKQNEALVKKVKEKLWDGYIRQKFVTTSKTVTSDQKYMLIS